MIYISLKKGMSSAQALYLTALFVLIGFISTNRYCLKELIKIQHNGAIEFLYKPF